MKTGATFSNCRTYRYALWRHWDESKPKAMFLMLNPSTADETRNDPTVERCQRRAEMMGYGGLLVCNIFALRSTDPKTLYVAEDPIGPQNDLAIIMGAKQSALIVCGWGAHGKYLGRGRAVHAMLTDRGYKPHYLRRTKDGQPGHPLYIGYDVQPQLWGAA